MIKRSVSPSASKYTSPESRAREFPSKAREMKLHLFWAASLFLGNFGLISLAGKNFPSHRHQQIFATKNLALF